MGSFNGQRWADSLVQSPKYNNKKKISDSILKIYAMWIYIKSYRTSYLRTVVLQYLACTHGTFPYQSNQCSSVPLLSFFIPLYFGWMRQRLPQFSPRIVVYYFFWRCCTSNFKHYQQTFGTYSKDPWQAQLAERVRESRWVGSSFSFTTSTQFQYIQIQKSHSKIARDGDVLHNLTCPCSSAPRCATQRWRTFEQRILGRK